MGLLNIFEMWNWPRMLPRFHLFGTQVPHTAPGLLKINTVSESQYKLASWLTERRPSLQWTGSLMPCHRIALAELVQ